MTVYTESNQVDKYGNVKCAWVCGWGVGVGGGGWGGGGGGWVGGWVGEGVCGKRTLLTGVFLVRALPRPPTLNSNQYGLRYIVI